VLILASLAFIVNEAITFRRQMNQELTALAGIIGLNTAADITFGDRKSATKTLEGLRARPYILSAYILTQDGEVFAKYIAPGTAPRRLKMEPREGDASWDRRAALAEITRESQEWWKDWDSDVEVLEQVFLDNQQIAVVVIQSDLLEVFSRLKWFFIMVIVILIATLAVAYVLSNRLQRPISDPILHLAETMKTVTDEKNYAIRATRESSDEIGQLIDGFNNMLAQIQQRDANLERYAGELKENNEELRTFAYIASHDLRTPLVNMQGFTGELRYALQDINSVLNDVLTSLGENNRTKMLTAFLKDVPEALGFIESSAGRMEDLVDAISKLSRLGLQELKPELVQVQTVVQSVLNDLQLIIDKNGIKVTVGPLPEIIADRNSLQMIFGSILDNAVKYLRPGVPGEIEITAESGPEGTVFSIRDNGRGIPNDQISKAFEMFRQVGEQDTPGEGVGLACAKTLVRRHGGRIWCTSILGTGTTFHFTISEKVEFPDQALVKESRSPLS
jgi:signal transduction histidine kinase